MRRNGLGWLGAWTAAAVWIAAAGCGDDGGTKPGGTPGNPLSLPLAEGSRWTFAVAETVEDDTDRFLRVDEVTGSRIHGGESYAVVRSILTEVGGANPETTVSHLRQAGQELFTFQEFDTAGLGGVEWLSDLFLALEETMPWRLAAFTSVSGEEWTLVDYERVWQIEGGTVTISVDAKVRNDGRTDLAVPAGSYSDVYVATVTQEFRALQNAPPLPPIQQRQLFTQKLYLKDGIGVLKEETLIRDQVTGSPEERRQIEAELESFETAP